MHNADAVCVYHNAKRVILTRSHIQEEWGFAKGRKGKRETDPVEKEEKEEKEQKEHKEEMREKREST